MSPGVSVPRSFSEAIRLLARWQLSPEVIAGVSYHNRPDDAAEGDSSPAVVIWAAEALCSACGLELPQEGTSDVAPQAVLDRLEVPEDEREALLAEVGTIGERARQFTD